MGGEERNGTRLLEENDIPAFPVQKVRQFLHQAGVPYERVREIAERAIREAKGQRTDGTEAGLLLFRTAGKWIEDAAGGEEPDHLFRFEEDELLVREIRSLPAGVRLPFILINLHDFNPEEAASVCRITAGEAKSAGETGYRLLEETDPDRNLERQINLLRRAYERIRYPEPESGHQAATAAGELNTDGPKGNNRWAAMAGLFAVIGSLVAASFVIPSWNAPIDAAYIRELEERFDEEKERFQEKIGASDMEMQGFFTIDEAENEFKSLMSDWEHDIEDGKAPKKREAEQIADKRMGVFDLPSEMIAELRDRPLTDDKAESRIFLQRFNNRKQELAMIVSARFMEHQDILKEAVHDGQLDTATFFGNADDYPKPLRHAVRLMEQEGYELSGEVWSVEDQVYPEPGKMPSLGEDAYKLEKSVARLAVIGETLEPITNILEQSPETIAEALIELEELDAGRDAGDQWTQPEEMAVQLFREMTFGGGTGRVFGDDGTVLAERRRIWRQIASNAGTLSGELMGPVVREMEQTGWKRSAAYNVLTPENYRNALTSSRGGTDRESEPEVVQSIFMPDPEYQVRAETLYLDLSQAGDRSLLEGETQVMVALLAVLAADREDEQMMALLSAKGDPADVAVLSEDGSVRVLEGGFIEFRESMIEHHETGIRAQVSVLPEQGIGREIRLTYTHEGLWLIDRTDTP